MSLFVFISSGGPWILTNIIDSLVLKVIFPRLTHFVPWLWKMAGLCSLKSELWSKSEDAFTEGSKTCSDHQPSAQCDLITALTHKSLHCWQFDAVLHLYRNLTHPRSLESYCNNLEKTVRLRFHQIWGLTQCRLWLMRRDKKPFSEPDIDLSLHFSRGLFSWENKRDG